MRDYSVDDVRSYFTSSSIDQITVGVCDDEHYVHDLVDKIIMKYAKEKHIEVFIEHFLTAEEVLDYCKKLDVLLLDIDMPEMDGIEVGHKLRKRNVDYKIIMLTGREDRYREAFEIEAYRFVTKPIDEGKLFKAIDDVRENNQLKRKVLVFRDGVQYSIPQKEILYVEANRSSTLIFTVNAEFRKLTRQMFLCIAAWVLLWGMAMMAGFDWQRSSVSPVPAFLLIYILLIWILLDVIMIILMAMLSFFAYVIVTKIPDGKMSSIGQVLLLFGGIGILLANRVRFAGADCHRAGGYEPITPYPAIAFILLYCGNIKRT